MEHVNGNQKWTLDGTEPYTKKDGANITLLVWRSHCVVCHAPIFCRTPQDFASSSAFGLRRCDQHKQSARKFLHV